MGFGESYANARASSVAYDIDHVAICRQGIAGLWTRIRDPGRRGHDRDGSSPDARAVYVPAHFSGCRYSRAEGCRATHSALNRLAPRDRGRLQMTRQTARSSLLGLASAMLLALDPSAALAQYVPVPIGDPARPDVIATILVNADTESTAALTEYNPA